MSSDASKCGGIFIRIVTRRAEKDNEGAMAIPSAKVKGEAVFESRVEILELDAGARRFFWTVVLGAIGFSILIYINPRLREAQSTVWGSRIALVLIYLLGSTLLAFLVRHYCSTFSVRVFPTEAHLINQWGMGFSAPIADWRARADSKMTGWGIRRVVSVEISNRRYTLMLSQADELLRALGMENADSPANSHSASPGATGKSHSAWFLRNILVAKVLVAIPCLLLGFRYGHWDWGWGRSRQQEAVRRPGAELDEIVSFVTKTLIEFPPSLNRTLSIEKWERTNGGRCHSQSQRVTCSGGGSSTGRVTSVTLTLYERSSRISELVFSFFPGTFLRSEMSPLLGRLPNYSGRTVTKYVRLSNNEIVGDFSNGQYRLRLNGRKGESSLTRVVLTEAASRNRYPCVITKRDGAGNVVGGTEKLLVSSAAECQGIVNMRNLATNAAKDTASGAVENMNCELTSRSFTEDGTTKLVTRKVHAQSPEECVRMQDELRLSTTALNYVSDESREERGKLNCRLNVRTVKLDGSIDGDETKLVHAISPEDCKRQSGEREVATDSGRRKVFVTTEWLK